MCPDNPDWIWVRSAEEAQILAAIEELFAPADAEGPATVRISVARLGDGSHALLFSAALPLCDFVNLVGWLDDPEVLPGGRGCVGWITSAATRDRYLVYVERSNANGDTALGLSESACAVRISIPDGRVALTSRPVRSLREPRLAPTTLGPHFPSVEVVVDTGFGNPGFAITDANDEFGA